jgi:hypothetical protein
MLHKGYINVAQVPQISPVLLLLLGLSKELK